MNNNAKRWVEALRSGEFEQGRGALCANGKYCCLGVACELAAREGVVTRKGDYRGSHVVQFILNERPYTLYLPPEVRNWLGLCNDGGTFEAPYYEARSSLANENDNGKSFSEIADIIESEPTGLFVS